MSPKRIAVLGGGASSLAAVWGLTHRPDWKQKFDITVYTLGWRLGGKGATGREAAQGNRILEHGLHLWFGFYENAHAMLKQVMKELDRPPSVPIRTWEQAMLPHNQFAMEQTFNGRWHAWSLPLPVNPSSPGDGEPFPPPWDVVIDGLQVLYDIWAAWNPREPANLTGLASTLLDAFKALGGANLEALVAPLVTESAHAALYIAKKVAELDRLAGGPSDRLLVLLVRSALNLIKKHLGDAVQTDLRAYRTWIAADAVGTILIGVLEDRLLDEGFDSINHLNFKDWVKKHGASHETLESCLVQSAYDSSFAFFRRADAPDFEAGTVLRGALRMFLMYKGSVVYRFAAGCGDTVFAPLYEVLKQRGVKFEFFHEVTEVVTPPSGPKEVTEVRLARQADLAVSEYEPLVTVKGLPVWPSEPRYDQLVQGAQLKSQGVNLESHWAAWAPVGQRVLKKGVDFDDVICGLSLEPLKLVARSLLDRHPPLFEMVHKLKTTRTQAFQLWTVPDLAGLGWTTGSALLSTFGEPLDTWADLTVTLPTESWPAGSEPKCVGYFCGAMTEGSDAIPPKTHHGFPDAQDAQARSDALAFMQDRLWALWPNAFSGSGPARSFRWELLADVANHSGLARFDAQFWRANIDPSERYVLSVTGTSKYRLRCDRTGFTNLYLVGDYADCGINAGSMEASFISGLQASRALSGEPAQIPGEGGGLT